MKSSTSKTFFLARPLMVAGMLFLLFTASEALAQMPTMGMPGSSTPKTSIPKGNGKISGILFDSASAKPVAFGTIALIDKKTNKPVDGAISGESGKFELTKVANGEYVLEYSFVGFKTSRSASFEINKGSEINLGRIALATEAKLLNEVTVTGMQDLVEERVDRLVYNAEKDVAAKGGDASDVLRKVPMLTVDLDGNVSLKGSQNVKVLINNKPSTIVASSVSNALKQIPADMIKSVEVITSPSAKYDAEGTGGIINIITKKNTLEGVTMSTDLGVGNRGTHLGLNGSYKRGKFGVNLGGFLRANYNVKGEYTNTQTTASPDGPVTTIQSADIDNQGLFGTYNLGWDYDIDSATFLTGSVRYSVMNLLNSQNNLTTKIFTPGNEMPIVGNRNVDVEDLSGTVDANITYTKIFKPSKELSIMGLFSRNNRRNNFISEILDPEQTSLIIGGIKNSNPSYNQESTIQIDYQAPIGKKQLVEVGGKGIFRNVNSDFTYFTLQDGSYIVDNSIASNVLSYNQNVTAAYLSHTITTKKKFSVKTGVRYEYTSISAEYTESGESLNSGIVDYGVLVPSINVSKSLKGGKTIKLGYNRRIQRPGIQFLNPNVNSSNPNNITVGNPYLSPELTDNIELGLSAQIKSVYINATFFARRTGETITSVRDTLTQIVNGESTNIISTTYENIGKEEAIGLNLFTNATLFSKWQIGLGGTIYQTYLTNNDPKLLATNSGFVASAFLFTSFNFGKGWALQGFGGGRGRQVQLQGYQGGFGFYSLGVKKDFKNKKGSIGIAGENFLSYPFNVRTEVSSPVLSQKSVTGMYNAGVRVNFTYRIGKMSFDGQGRRKKAIKNDDVKGGVSEDNNSGAPAGGGPAGGGPPRQ